jgi:hypothetical protein
MKELNVADNQLALKADAQTMSDVDISGVAALANVISGMGALQCADGTPYQSKKSFMMSTHVCHNCGQHKRQHASR